MVRPSLYNSQTAIYYGFINMFWFHFYAAFKGDGFMLAAAKQEIRSKLEVRTNLTSLIEH